MADNDNQVDVEPLSDLEHDTETFEHLEEEQKDEELNEDEGDSDEEEEEEEGNDDQVPEQEIVREESHEEADSIPDEGTEEEALNEDIKEYIEIFKIFDQEKQKELSSQGLQMCLQAINVKITPTEFACFLEENDLTEAGPFNQEIYLKLVKQFTSEPKNEKEELREAFKFFDSEEKGYLTKQELQFILSNLGLKIPEKKANKLLKEVMGVSDEAFYYEDFLKKLD